MSSYQLLEHTADLGIRVWGKDLKALFINSASAMYDLIVDAGTVRPVKFIKINAKAQDRDELLKNWLSELLYYFHVKDIVFNRFDIVKLDEKKVVSIAMGEKIDEDRHSLQHEIKAVTFHALNIHKTDNRLSTDIIFDI
jgi:SHS2 domain-containing protein